MKKVINIRVLVQVVFFIFAIFSIRFLELSISRLVVLGITFLIGSYHCGWICPFGKLQEYIGKIRKKFIKNTYNSDIKLLLCSLCNTATSLFSKKTIIMVSENCGTTRAPSKTANSIPTWEATRKMCICPLLQKWTTGRRNIYLLDYD